MPNAIREFRKRQGWTQDEVSDLVGLSSAYLSLIERDLREPSPAMKVRIARALGTRVKNLWPSERAAVDA